MPFVDGGQILSDETHDRLKESLAGVGVLRHQERCEVGMLAVDRHCECPVVGIEVPEEDAAGGLLGHRRSPDCRCARQCRQLLVARPENPGDPLRFLTPVSLAGAPSVDRNHAAVLTICPAW